MSISSLQLDAFFAVAQLRNFSLAAKKLHLTQSALSQRVLNLEEELGASLFIRDSAGVRVTELGQRLLQYCQSKNSLEEEFLTSIPSNASAELTGVLRVGGFSTIASSVLVPLLADLVKDFPKVDVDLQCAELRHLPSLLQTGALDYIFLTQDWEKQGVESQLVGHEENVQIRSSLSRARESVFLDHDSEDPTTAEFLKLQGKKNLKYRRNYLDDIELILEGVKHGIGQAVVPLHLVRNVKGIEVVSQTKTLRVPIYLCHFKQSFPTRLHQAIVEKVRQKFRNFL